jgi:hypothetical protein
MMSEIPSWQKKRTWLWTLVGGMWMLRMVLCLWPQYGYIHPDEFFQTLEPFTGNTMENTKKTESDP